MWTRSRTTLFCSKQLLINMQRAWELNNAVLGGPLDTLHLDRRIPRHFVSNGFFHFGL